MTTLLELPSSTKIVGGRAAIYVRVSTDRQETGASLDVQLESCRRYCEQNGLDLVGEFKDIESGLHVDRPQYQQALSLAKAKGFNQLVCYRYDRTGRDDAEFMGMLRDFAKLGITLVSASGESPDPLYQKLAGVLAWDESRRISIRVTGAKVKRFENGYWSSKPPFGYVTEKQPEGGSILVERQGEAELVTEIFERYSTGRYSLREIQRWLNASLTEKQKSRRGINQILSSRVYLGEVPYGRYVASEFHPRPEEPEWRPGKHSGLTTGYVFDKVQQMLHENKRSWGKGSKGVAGPSRGGPNARYLFTGLVYCGTCGSRYVGSPRSGTNKWPHYMCGRKHTGIGCKSPTIYETKLREPVIPPIEALLSKLKQEDVRVAVRAELVRQQEDNRTDNQLTNVGLIARMEKAEARLSALEDTYLDGDIVVSRYRKKRDELSSNIKELKGQLEAKPRLILPDVDQLFSIAENISIADLDQQSWREIILAMVEKIVISSVGSDGRKTPAIVTVQWKSEYAGLMAQCQ